MAGSLCCDAVRHAGAANVEPWILSVAAGYSRRVPYELRSDGAVRGDVRAALNRVERPGWTSRQAFWREAGSGLGTGDGCGRVSGVEPGSKFCHGVRGARTVALGISLLLCVRDGGGGTDVSTRGARRVHGNSRRCFVARFRGRRAFGWGDWA